MSRFYSVTLSMAQFDSGGAIERCKIFCLWNILFLIETIVIFNSVVTFVTWSEQHLAFPINYCSLSMACVHDSRPVCATSPDGCSRRKFLDQCDMFEYNCDYNAHYEMVVCQSPNNNSENLESSCTPQVSTLYTTAKEDYFYSIYKVKSSFIDNEETSTTVPSEAHSEVEILKEFTSDEEFTAETIQESTTQKDSVCIINCNRPRSWGTTAKGETRDFFRILQDSVTDE